MSIKTVRTIRPAAGGSPFPADFAWGVAAASYQIEGAAREDGRGPSVWDMFCRKEGAVWKGHNGDTACDHYYRWREDVELMRQIGVKAYRMSVAWPRVLPEGVGKVNAKGLAFYDRLVDALLTAGVTPWVTLFHWDYPLALYRCGGWLNRDSAEWFADYAAVVVERLGDRVARWMTHNEPQCTIGLGHQTGMHAPGDKLATAEWLLAGHNLLRSHGRAVQAIRAHSPKKARVGYAPVGVGKIPATDRAADVAAAKRATFAVAERGVWNAAWWVDPVVLGRYPEDGLKLFGKDAPPFTDADMRVIRQPLDFLGMNVYHSPRVRAARGGKVETVDEPQGHPLTTYLWPITPESLYWLPKFWQERYKLPLAITENGMGNVDWVARDGYVHDPQRIDFAARYAAPSPTAPTFRAYFHWSILDNFEWNEGYKQRFGLVYVDYATGKRTPKDSAWWYRDLIARNGQVELTAR